MTELEPVETHSDEEARPPTAVVPFSRQDSATPQSRSNGRPHAPPTPRSGGARRRHALDRRYVARICVRAALTSTAAVFTSAVFRLVQALVATIVLARSRNETCDNADLLRLWLAGYTVRCCIIARVLYTRHRLYQRGAAQRAGGAVNMYRERARTEHCKARLDSLGTVSFVLGALWLFGSLDCPTAAPVLTHLTLAYLLIGFLSLFVPVLFFAALVTLLPCVLAVLNAYADSLGLRRSGGGEGDEEGPDAEYRWIEELPKHSFVAATSPVGDGSTADLEEGGPSTPELPQKPPLSCENESDESPTASSPPGGGGAGGEEFHDSASMAGSEDSGCSNASSRAACPHGGWLGKRHVEAEDACCCVCLGRYVPGAAVRELPPCGHHFHANCIETWLRVNASCPLCKARVGPSADEASEDNPYGEESPAVARDAYLAAAVRGGDDLFSVLV